MKKISKLICLILSLILIMAFTCSCKETEKVPKSEQVLQAIMQVEKEIDGYKLLYHDSLIDVRSDYAYVSTQNEEYIYQRETQNSKIQITRVSDGTTKEITLLSIIEKSQAGAKLKQIFDEKQIGFSSDGRRSFGEYMRIASFDDRLFIIFSGSDWYRVIEDAGLAGAVFGAFLYFWAPPIFFEYDFDSEEIKYAGYAENAREYDGKMADYIEIQKTN